ncbi:MAG: hypothetical protein EXS59_00155 [Candidatus Taylorbacteria bacterium]|nr:hypothetical protein [Candidatus Taylorbacteria bacterium]
MKNSQKGFIVPLLLGIIAILVVGGGVYIYESKRVEVPAVVDTGTQPANQNQQQTNTQTPPVIAQQNISNNSETVNWKTYQNSSEKYSVKYPANWYLLSYNPEFVSIINYDSSIGGRGGSPSSENIRIVISTYTNLLANETIESWANRIGLSDKQNISIDGLKAIRGKTSSSGSDVREVFSDVRAVFNGKGYQIGYSPSDSKLVSTFDNILSTLKFMKSDPTSEIPNIIKNITTNPETGDQKPEHNSLVIDQVKKDVQGGKLVWFKDPVEVSKKYGVRFGIASNSIYSLETAAYFGGDSGLMYSTVLATSATKSYRIYLISEQNQHYVWLVNAVTDIQQANKLRVNSFTSATTFDVDGVGHQEIIQRFGDGTTLFYLNVKKPLVTFNLNQPANSSSVNSDSIIVKVNGTVLSGVTAKAVTEQGSSHGATFPMYSIQVDLSGVTNLKNYAGQNIQIILTDKIKDDSGNPLQQCDRAYNKGECITDTSGQKVKVFGAELKLYSL